MLDHDNDPRCRRLDGVRVTSRHLRDCETAGCEGCEPCRRRHCGCGRHLRDSEHLTCARCVGRTRDDLTRIGDLCSLAPVAAIEKPLGSAAAVLAGPVPEHSTHAARRRWAYGGALCRCKPGTCPDTLAYYGPAHATTACKDSTCLRVLGMPACPGLVDWLEYADDEQHPLWVLGSWDMLVAEHLDHDRRNRVTIAGAAAYLAMQLTYLAQDEDFAFDELARQVRDCRAHVEDVLEVAEHVQKGAACQTCRKAMERVYGASVDGEQDRWRCDCGTLTVGEYEERVYRGYLANAPRLTAAQILAQYRIPEGTVRRWANGWTDHFGIWHDPVVRKHGYDGTGRQLYDVTDVVRMRDASAA